MNRQALIVRLLLFADYFCIGAQELLNGPLSNVSVQLESVHKGCLYSQILAGFGQVMFGSEKPTLAICHHELYWQIYYAIIPAHREPKLNEEGAPSDWINFNGAYLTWHKDCKWRGIVLLNENCMGVQKLNGWLDVIL